jgi:hypothetical protein
MIVVHATTYNRLDSIEKGGFKTCYSRGKRPAVWFACPSARHWAWLHVQRKHKPKDGKVVLFTVDVPRSWLKRHGPRGLYYCVRDVPASRIRQWTVYGELLSRKVEA